MSIDNTIHLVYIRYYNDPEDYGYPFGAYHTIFRNVPVKYLSKLNNKQFKERTKKLMDSKYKEDATNFTGETEVAILHGLDYYETYEDAFGEVATGDNSLFNDYGQLWDTRYGFKYDFNPKITAKYKSKFNNNNVN